MTLKQTNDPELLLEAARDLLRARNEWRRIAELRLAENERLSKCCTQRGARMQIMREWMDDFESGGLWEKDSVWGALTEVRPDATKWFDNDGVPVDAAIDAARGH